MLQRKRRTWTMDIQGKILRNLHFVVFPICIVIIVIHAYFIYLVYYSTFLMGIMMAIILFALYIISYSYDVAQEIRRIDRFR